jgi:uncharacterized membrane protein
VKHFAAMLKATLLGGLLFLLPIVAIVLAVGKAMQLAKTVAKPLAGLIPLDRVAGVAVATVLEAIIVVLFCFLAGVATRSLFRGRWAQKAEKRFLWLVPGYGIVKVLAETAGGSAKSPRPILVSLDDNAQVGYEIERLADGRVVAFLPGAPSPWSGVVVVVTPERVEPLPTTTTAVSRSLRLLGRGTKELFDSHGAQPGGAEGPGPALRPPHALGRGARQPS